MKVYDTPLTERQMFRGKNLPGFLEARQHEFAFLLDTYGREKFDKVYGYFFRKLASMQWGQWIVVEKACPREEDRHLFRFVVELIYQSDILSRFRLERLEGETRIHIDAPSEEQQKKWSIFLGDHRYILIDWYGRLCKDPGCNSDIDPEWICLEAVQEASQWGEPVMQESDDP